MKYVRQVLAMCAFMGAMGAAAPLMAADAQKQAVGKEPPKDLILKGDAKCTGCHDEADDPVPSMLDLHPSVLAIGKTRHGTRADGRTPTCTDCHGESDDHLNYKGKDKPPKPDRVFTKHSKTPVASRNEACLTCHQGGKHMNWDTSAHATHDVACTSCHNVHAAQDKVRDKRTQPEVCYACHKQQRADMSKPSHHPVPEGKMACSDCHNPHGSAGEKMLVKDTTNATCFTCHAEKRGPFIHNHQPVEDNCSNCHNPHGTTAPSMLKMRMPFLCQQCHGDASHPGNVAGVRTLMPDAISSNSGPGMAQARGCNNCHTNIHGSNSPSNATSSGAGRFFR